MQALPLITRNPYQLVLLSPGTFTASNRLGGFSVKRWPHGEQQLHARRRRQQRYVRAWNRGRSPEREPGLDRRVSRHYDNFNAEFGRNTGAIIDVVTKSGTNQLHGSAYYFGRWNGFGGARDWFNPGEGPNAGPMNPYIRHQFGFSVGGPIIKDKTFFFFNNEWNRFITALTGQATVPTTDFLTDNLITPILIQTVCCTRTCQSI